MPTKDYVPRDERIRLWLEAREKRERDRQAALAKLTPYERELLGL